MEGENQHAEQQKKFYSLQNIFDADDKQIDNKVFRMLDLRSANLNQHPERDN